VKFLQEIPKQELEPATTRMEEQATTRMEELELELEQAAPHMEEQEPGLD
jgi:hypothetical protein